MTDLQQLPDALMNGGGAHVVAAPAENVGAKRLRRPSVRLGDIGDQSYDSVASRRAHKQWKIPVRDSSKGSRTRPMTNLAGEYPQETLDSDEREGGDLIGVWRARESKQKRCSTKRVRSNWVISKSDDCGRSGREGDEKFSGGEDVDNDDGQSPVHSPKDRSPIHSLDKMEDDDDRGQEIEANMCGDSGMRARARASKDFEGPSDTDTRNWNSGERNGVRVWLNQLGLGRYAPVFEIHEVDDEVLPLLTLEDLKDMGINAVGSRRKMYCAIQKLSKGFS